MRIWLLLISSVIFFSPYKSVNRSKDESTYKVHRIKQAIKIDADWNKPQWKKVKPVQIKNFMGKLPAFNPIAQAKMMYDDENLYLIFQVKDRHVRSLVTAHQGPVYTDACVEFFFSPDTNAPLNYFNIETNCGGAILLGYQDAASKKRSRIPVKDINEIEIAHSMPDVVPEEIDSPTTWTVEYRVPLSMLQKNANLTPPKKGVSWKANFYKVAQSGSNPHYKTWAVVQNDRPNFHLPQYFGTLTFQ